MSGDGDPNVTLAADLARAAALGVRVRLRWWVKPSMWIANKLLRAVAKHGVKTSKIR